MSDDFVVGQKAGDYEILGVLGAGGMGKVYKVRNVISDRVEAMKVVLANPASQKELADRFLREIKVLASLNHPNIAPLRTALTIDNRLVMIMEYVEGETLASRLEKGPIPAGDAVNYVSQILSALSYAHGLGVVHRDIKPANMILTPAGVVKLMDFGIARPSNDTSMTMTGTALGSLNYMSPEQVRGDVVDARSDLYSLGVSLYEMVTGQLPFRGHSNYSVMSAHLQDAPAPPITMRPELPQGLNDIILMSLAKDPKGRFQSADAFRNALKSVMPDAVPVAPTVAAAWPTPTPARPLAATVPLAPVTPAPPPVSQPVTVAQPAPVAVAAAAASSPAAGSEYRVPPAAGSQRGIYMALGGVLVLAMLAGAAIYLPRRAKTQASPSSSAAAPAAPAASTDSVAVGSDGSVKVASGADSVAVGSDGVKITSSDGAAAPNPPPDASAAASAPSSPAAASAATPAPASHASVSSSAAAAANATAKKAQQDAAAAQAAQQADADRQAAQAKEAALADEEKQTDQLNARAVSISQGLDTMRRAQAAQGVGLRGDIASAEELMKTNLTRAQGAIDRGDPDKAKEYLDIAEAQAEKIEHFLGR
jgi:eukaryotic-like serine/threonine-protein kinase